MFTPPADTSSQTDMILAEALISENPTALDALSGYVDEADLAFFRTICAAPSADVDALLRIAAWAAAQNWTAAPATAYALSLTFLNNAADQAYVLDKAMKWRCSIGQTNKAEQDCRALARLRNTPPPPGLMPELESADFAIISSWTSPQEYAQLAALPSILLNDPLRDPSWMKQAFLQTVTPMNGRSDDASFFVVDSNFAPILRVECDVEGLMPMGCRNTGIVLTQSAPAPAEAIDLAYRQISLAAAWLGTSALHYDLLDGADIVPPDRIDIYSHNRDLDRRFALCGLDLSLSAKDILRGFRETHRQQTQWGIKNMTIRSDRDMGQAVIGEYLDLVKRSGLETPDDETRLIADLAAGHHAYYLSYLDGAAIGAVSVSRHGTSVYYASSRRAGGGSKPITHALLHQAILDAKAEGFKRFEFGFLHLDEGFPEKLRNIAKFKLGFGGDLRYGTRRAYGI